MIECPQCGTKFWNEFDLDKVGSYYRCPICLHRVDNNKSDYQQLTDSLFDEL